MSTRPEQPEPYLRGCVFPAVYDAPYPRADPAGAEYLPADVWDAARLPVGVRLEMQGTAQTVRVWYETTRPSLGYRGESAGCSFVAYRGGQKVATVDAVMGEGMAELTLTGRPDLPVTVYLPEGMRPLITGVAGLEESMTPAPLQPRWLAYGDAVTQGWLASAPAMAWPAVAGRKLGLDVCNLGYAGMARGETTSAIMLSDTPAEVISIAFGLNNWSRVPHTTGLMVEEVRCFLDVVRQGHPETPIVVVSPTARPDAEDEPNRLGATLAELRQAMEETVREHIAAGDESLSLVEGLHIVDPDDLEDGVYPGDEGHRRLAAAVAKVLVPQRSDLQAAAEKRWANEGVEPNPGPRRSVPPRPDSPASIRPVLDTDELDAMFPVLDPTALLDGPALNGSAVNGSAVNGSAVNGAAVNGAAVSASVVNGAAVNGAAVNGTAVNGAAVKATVVHGAVPNGAPDGAEVEDDAPPLEAPAAVDPPVDHHSAELPAPDASSTVAPDDTSPAADSTISAGTETETEAEPPKAETIKPVRRDMEPVDIAIADMVVAALTLATNGADDIIYGHDPEPVDDVLWADVPEGVPTYELQWPDETASTYELQWPDGVDPGTDPSWTEPAVQYDADHYDPAPYNIPYDTAASDTALTDEQQWMETAGSLPTDELQWAAAAVDSVPTDDIQWVETVDPAAY